MMLVKDDQSLSDEDAVEKKQHTQVRTYRPYVILGGTIDEMGNAIAKSSFSGYMRDVRIYTKYYHSHYLIDNIERMPYAHSMENPELVAFWRLNDTFEIGSNEFNFQDSSKFQQKM